MHAVDSVTELMPLTSVEYVTKPGRVEHLIYIFDQEAAKIGLRYFVVSGRGSRCYGFRIKLLVSKKMEAAAQRILEKLRR